MAQELPKRDEVAVENKWNLKDIYVNEKSWEDDFKKVEKLLIKVEDFKGKLISSGQTLYQGLNLIMEIQRILALLSAYAHMSQDQDLGNEKYQILFNRVQGLENKVNSITSFMVPEILTLSWEKIDTFISKTEGLELYRHLLANINRQKKHYRSAKEERLIAMAGDMAQGASNIFSMLNDADLNFPLIKDEEGNEIRITHGRFLKLMESKDRRVRKDAFLGLYSRYAQFINTFASTLDTAIKGNIYFARVHNYDSALAATLNTDNIPLKLYDNLISTVSSNLDTMHQYIELRKEILELEQLHMYDLYTPLVSELDLKISYQQAQEIILQALAPLGDEYISILKKGFQENWIDVYENQGKRSGAYSSGAYGVHPYVLLNYKDNINNLFTLAHEMGHALHSYYSNENQPFVYANYKIFLAEVASTLNEALLIKYLLDNSESKEKKRYIINYYLEQFRGTVFRQTMFAEFEKTIYTKAENGEPLRPQLLKELYHKLNQKYYGSQLIIDQKIDNEWARIPHFYYNFYVYKYATGFAAATALSLKILNEGEKAVEDYLEFLKSGDSDYPLNLLKKAGVDMTSAEPIKAALNIFKEYVYKLNELS